MCAVSFSLVKIHFNLICVYTIFTPHKCYWLITTDLPVTYTFHTHIHMDSSRNWISAVRFGSTIQVKNI